MLCFDAFASNVFGFTAIPKIDDQAAASVHIYMQKVKIIGAISVMPTCLYGLALSLFFSISWKYFWEDDLKLSDSEPKNYLVNLI